MALAGLYDILLEKNLEESLDYVKKNNLRTSLRVRLIIFSLAQKLNTAETNQLLQDNYCEKLYARNIHDATLMYTLNNKLSLEEWLAFDDRSVRSLEQAQLDIEVSGTDGNAPLELERIHSRANPLNFGLRDLDAYCEKYDPMNFVAKNYTAGYTKGLEKYIISTRDTEVFQNFITNNAEKFVATRQRTRWHFISFLRDYIEYSMEFDKIIPITENTEKIDHEDGKLKLFFGDTPTRIRIPGIIERMNNFFEGYMFFPLKAFFDEEIADATSSQYKKFEVFFQKIITGRTDVTRNFFIMFAMFVSESVQKTLTLTKLNGILADCGFTGIREHTNSGLDCYVVSMLDYRGPDISRSILSAELIGDLVDEDTFVDNIAFLFDSRRAPTASTLQEDTAQLMHETQV